MKKIYILLCVAFEGLAPGANAQAPFPTMDSITINNINAAILVHGDMWWNPATSAPKCVLEGTMGHIISNAGAIWMSGYDGSGALHIAAQTYRQDGNDYWPGPLDASGALTYTTSQSWAKIWKVYRSDIEYFLSLGTHTTANTPQMILTWPAKGNAYAQGNAGATLTITDNMAPFVDLNGNGIYEPLLGEYPNIPGDEALWWVFSDNGPTHSQTNGRSLDVEVHVMCYGYHRGTTIDNVVYYVYTLVNKSANNYSNFRIAQWDDVQIQYPHDDFIGFDSVWRMGINYNGVPCDSCSGAGTPPEPGIPSPSSAVTMVVLPGDVPPGYVPAGSFTYYNNDSSIIGFPYVDTQYDNYMRSKSKTGSHVMDDFQGPGIPSTGYNPGPDCNYVFTGNPSNNAQWSECSANNNPGSRCSILSSNDFVLNTGGTQVVVFALIAADTVGGCPYTSFDSIRVVADTAWKDYFTPLLPSAVASVVSAQSSITLHPNPAHDELYIEDGSNNTGDASITIYNVIGQVMTVPVQNNAQQSQVDVSMLPDGLYNVLYRKGTTQTCVKFVKE